MDPTRRVHEARTEQGGPGPSLSGCVDRRKARPRIRGGDFIGMITLSGLLAFLPFAAGCEGGGDDGDAFRVGLVFDVGGLGDKSFNDSAYAGLLRARDELGIVFEYFEPGDGSDREAALRIFSAGKTDLIIGVGFLFTDDITKVAGEFPDKKYVCVDYTWSEGKEIPENLLGIRFREEEGAFLVGTAAGLVTETATVGFVGGMDIPLIHKFEAGYRAGVMAARPDARVLVQYAGVTDDAFKNPSKGRELALSQIDAGADVIFHASGSTGLGVFEAVRQRDKLAIGVDADQSDEAPDHILTSMTKNVDVAVFDAVRAAVAGEFAGGIRHEGLREGAVGYVLKEQNERWLTPEIVEQVESFRRRIIDGEITVPTQ